MGSLFHLNDNVIAEILKQQYHAEHQDKKRVNEERYVVQAERLSNETLQEVKKNAVKTNPGESFTEAAKKYAIDLGIYGTYDTKSGEAIFDESGNDEAVSEWIFRQRRGILYGVIPEEIRDRAFGRGNRMFQKWYSF